MSNRELLKSLTYWELCGRRLKKNWTKAQWEAAEKAWKVIHNQTHVIPPEPATLDDVDDILGIIKLED